MLVSGLRLRCTTWAALRYPGAAAFVVAFEGVAWLVHDTRFNQLRPNDRVEHSEHQVIDLAAAGRGTAVQFLDGVLL